MIDRINMNHYQILVAINFINKNKSHNTISFSPSEFSCTKRTSETCSHLLVWVVYFFGLWKSRIKHFLLSWLDWGPSWFPCVLGFHKNVIILNLVSFDWCPQCLQKVKFFACLRHSTFIWSKINLICTLYSSPGQFHPLHNA